MTEEENKVLDCSNCGNELEATAIFCGHCGQKGEQSRINFREMMKVFFYALLNADSTLWRTIKHIWIPGKLTKEYFSGKRKSYFHPVRLFLFSWVLFFAVFTVGSQIGPDESNNVNIFQLIDKRVSTKKTVNHLIDRRDYWLEISDDSLTREALDDLVLSTAGVLEEEWKIDEIDSLRISLDSRKDSFSVVILGHAKKLDVAYEDLLSLGDSELFERYQITGFINQVVAKQLLKIFRDTSGMIQFLVKGISWMVLISIPLMSLILYAMYFYRNHYLVEHVVFLLHIHSLLFIVFLVIRFFEWILSSLALPLGIEEINLWYLYVFGLIYALIYPLKGLSVFYKSSIIGVVVKGIFFFIAYFFIATFSVFVAMVLRFLLF